MKKIVLSDLVEIEEKNEMNPIFLYNKQELHDKEEFIKPKEDFFDLKPTTALEKDIYKILSSEKNLLKQKARENLLLAQFDSKMHRIKKIKSKTYRRIKRQEKIKTMLVDSENNENTKENAEIKNNLNPTNLLEKHEMENKEENVNNIFEFGKEDCSKDRKLQLDMVKSIFENENNDFVNDFIDQKETNITNDAPNQIKEVLPGWGDWAGTDLEIIESKYNTTIKFKDGVKCEDRNDHKLNHVIINENTAKLDKKYIANIPYGYTEEDYKMKMETPVTKEWASTKSKKKHYNNIKKIKRDN